MLFGADIAHKITGFIRIFTYFYRKKEVMKYSNVTEGTFVRRLNRFVAEVNINNKLETVHVKNTGRMGELLFPNARVALTETGNPNRKTKYDLISVYKESLGWVNIDSQAPNKVVGEWLATQDYTFIKPEYKYGDSRLDFYMEKEEVTYLMEVKGCTLEIDGIGYFPDAPSERAVRHLRELIRAKNQGYHCIIAFVIAMPEVKKVLPNMTTHPAFGVALEEARKAGVEVWYLPCEITKDSIKITEKLVSQSFL